MKTIRTAAIQLNSQPDSEQSIRQARILVDEAADQGAELVCLPENFAFLGDEREKFRQAPYIAKAVERELPAWASQLDIAILGGGYPASAGEGKIYNRSLLVLRDGSVAAAYDKIHLFDVSVTKNDTYRESATVQGGRPEAVVYRNDDLPAIGFSICYDVRFPELYRKLMEKGAQILTVPSAFTRPTGKAHWEVLLRARAIENSCYVIAPAQTGQHGEKRETYGHSLIIDPWGTVLRDAGEEPGVIMFDLDLQVVEDVRRKLPSITHRRM